MVAPCGTAVDVGLQRLQMVRKELVVYAYGNGIAVETPPGTIADHPESIVKSLALEALAGVGNGGVIEIATNDYRQAVRLTSYKIRDFIGHFRPNHGSTRHFSEDRLRLMEGVVERRFKATGLADKLLVTLTVGNGKVVRLQMGVHDQQFTLPGRVSQPKCHCGIGTVLTDGF